jgi:hypothetical protein
MGCTSIPFMGCTACTELRDTSVCLSAIGLNISILILRSVYYQLHCFLTPIACFVSQLIIRALTADSDCCTDLRVSKKVRGFAIISGLRSVALFVQCSPGQTEEYQAKPTVNEVWVRFERGIL